MNRVRLQDPVLQQACRRSSVRYEDLGLPQEMTVWVDPGEVSCRWVWNLPGGGPVRPSASLMGRRRCPLQVRRAQRSVFRLPGEWLSPRRRRILPPHPRRRGAGQPRGPVGKLFGRGRGRRQQREHQQLVPLLRPRPVDQPGAQNHPDRQQPQQRLPGRPGSADAHTANVEMPRTDSRSSTVQRVLSRRSSDLAEGEAEGLLR